MCLKQSGGEPADFRFPNVCVEAIYVPLVKPNNTGGYVKVNQNHRAYEGGNFLILVIRVCKLEEQLSSELLNHFIIVQNVFRQEVKEVISKVSENSAPNGWNFVQSTAGKAADATLRSFGSDHESQNVNKEDFLDDSLPFMLHAKLIVDVSCFLMFYSLITSNYLQGFCSDTESYGHHSHEQCSSDSFGQPRSGPF